MKKVLINVLLPVCAMVLTLSGCQRAGEHKVESFPSRISAPVVSLAMKPATLNADGVGEHFMPATGSSGSVGPAINTSSNILTCQSDLSSLKQVNDKVWKVRKRDFDSLVAGASVYASVRTEVNGKTRDTLDALYRFKTNQLCVQIERDVLDGLIVRGGSIK